MLTVIMEEAETNPTAPRTKKKSVGKKKAAKIASKSRRVRIEEINKIQSAEETTVNAITTAETRSNLPREASLMSQEKLGEDLMKLTVVELKQRCRDQGLKVGGLKRDLVERLQDNAA